MSNSFFQFKQFLIHQDKTAMKVTTDSCLFGAWAAEQVKNQKLKVKTILDIGAGTGLLSLMIIQKNIDAAIDGIEIDKDAAEQAKENVDAFSLKEKIQIFHADTKEFEFSRKYDVIISNPPFYENELLSGDIKKNKAHHHESLLLNELAIIIQNNLHPAGDFFLLLPYKRINEVKKILPQNGLGITEIVLVRQSTSHDYFRIMIEGGLLTESSTEPITKELSVTDENRNYTPEFIELLKDYYLYL